MLLSNGSINNASQIVQGEERSYISKLSLSDFQFSFCFEHPVGRKLSGRSFSYLGLETLSPPWGLIDTWVTDKT